MPTPSHDAYLPWFSAAKHPRALGQPGRECWTEVWDANGPIDVAQTIVSAPPGLIGARFWLRRGKDQDESRSGRDECPRHIGQPAECELFLVFERLGSTNHQDQRAADRGNTPQHTQYGERRKGQDRGFLVLTSITQRAPPIAEGGFRAAIQRHRVTGFRQAARKGMLRRNPHSPEPIGTHRELPRWNGKYSIPFRGRSAWWCRKIQRGARPVPR